MASRTRIGLLVPSSNTVAEPVSQVIAAPVEGLTLHFNRVRVKTISLEESASEQFAADAVANAAALLGDAGVDALAWAATSGSWLGPSSDRVLVGRLATEAGAPATTSTIALLQAAELFAVKRIGLVTPYVKEVVDAIAINFAAEGVEVVSEQHLGITTNFAFGQVSKTTLRQLIQKVATAPVDAIAVVCTNLAAAGLAEELEAEIGIPILDSVAVTLWHALSLAGREVPIPGWGRLLGGHGDALRAARSSA